MTVELQANYQKLSTSLNEKLKTPQIFSAAIEAFDSIEEWYDS